MNATGNIARFARSTQCRLIRFDPLRRDDWRPYAIDLLTDDELEAIAAQEKEDV